MCEGLCWTSACDRGASYASHCRIDWERYRRAEDVIRIIVPLGFDQPFDVATIAIRRTVRVGGREEIRISARKRRRLEGLQRGASPFLVTSLLEFVRPIDESSENLDEHMIAAEAEGGCLDRYSRGDALELVGEDGATRRDSGLHRLDENVDAAVVERGKPTRLHERPLPIDDIGVDCGQRGPI